MAGPSRARRRELARMGEADPNGKYPTDTRGRAVAAKSRASEMANKGVISSAHKAEIDRRADKKLGKKW